MKTSALRQQRWLRCLNVDDEEIPAFGMVQIYWEPYETLTVDGDGNLVYTFPQIGDDVVYQVKRVYTFYSLFGASTTIPTMSVDDIGFTNKNPIPSGSEGLFTLDTPTLALASYGDGLSVFMPHPNSIDPWKLREVYPPNAAQGGDPPFPDVIALSVFYGLGRILGNGIDAEMVRRFRWSGI